MPMLMPPWTWASARAGLMSFPESWTLTRRSTLTLPTGMSTSTSAKQQPKAKVFSLQWLVPSAVMWTLCSRE